MRPPLLPPSLPPALRRRRTRRSLLRWAALVLVLAATARAQSIDTIRANPEAVALRKIWEVRGQKEGENAGLSFAGLGDIYRTGASAWCVRHGTPSGIRFYTWDRRGDTAQLQQAILGYSSALVGPLVGDFRGDGHPLVGLRRNDQVIDLFETGRGRIDTPWVIAVDPLAQTPQVQSRFVDAKVADLDRDGADELIVLYSGRTIEGVSTRKPEVWIYRGGPGFRGDTPTVVLQDSQGNSGVPGRLFLVVGRLDDDPYADVMTGCDYADGIQRLKIYFGREGSPWNWSAPDRQIVFGDLFALDCDGDAMLDLAIATTPFLKPGTPTSIALFLSSSGKSMRDRPLDSTDIDRILVNSVYSYPQSAGFLNDSARRFEMLRLVTIPTRLLGGGPSGPDPFYDAFGGLGPLSKQTPDLDGDGWSDAMTGNDLDDYERGFCQIYAGGPYIPRDPSAGVRWIGDGDRAQAIAVWPNPARQEAHIAWRGDLRRMPRGFEVYDLSGRLRARGETASWRGEALWNCADAPAGVYLARILDFQGGTIAVTSLRVLH